MTKIGVSKVSTLWETFRIMIIEQGYSIEKALPYFTTNVAKGLHIDDHKGSIEVGKDADLLLIDEQYYLDFVMAKGKIMMKDKKNST